MFMDAELKTEQKEKSTPLLLAKLLDGVSNSSNQSMWSRRTRNQNSKDIQELSLQKAKET